MVTVVIPTRNRRALLEEAVASVQRQTRRHWELIVVDDCSEDGTWAWLSSLRDPRIRAMRLEQHSERSAARNGGLAEARGMYVLFLDDDDLLTPRALERLMEAARRHPDAVGVAGAAVQFDARGHRRRVSWVGRRWKGRVWPVVLWGRWILQGQAAIRRDEILEVGGWGEHLAAGEDQELWLRLGLRGPAVLLPDSVLENRAHVTWRGADTAEVESRFRQAFVESLTGADAKLAHRVLASREAFGCAGQAYVENRLRDALACWARSVRAAPDVTLSAPLRWTVLALGARILLGVVLGPRALDLLRRAWARGRELLRAAPQGQVHVSGSALRDEGQRSGD
ncbi:MAG: glycosyltransferase family 2 protein [Armatimonadota bacterium]|nr:glycosyltransferase family 2 protein [Armatimonadota bacterium]